jgi:hypothetical protein
MGSFKARLFAEHELADVSASRYPNLLKLSRSEMVALLGRLREQRDRAQTISRQQRREMRGKLKRAVRHPPAII